MPLAQKPGAWQLDVAQALRSALQDGLLASAPSSDGAAPQPAAQASAQASAAEQPAPPPTAWRTARVDIAEVSRRLAPAASMAPLYLRCLTHYRDDLRAQDVDADDAGAALACMLAASLQALEAHAVTLPRWSRITTWLVGHVMPAVDWSRASTVEQQQFFARMALLAVALGEWSLEASKRGTAAQATARLMAKQHLEVEFGLDAELLLKSMRWLDVIPAT
jgi:hypothetical protein